jgi:large subunit ribosomal protein L15
LADENKFESNKVDFDTLINLGVISKKRVPLKILGNGELTAVLEITAHGFSRTAKEKIESVGGKVTVNE